MDSNTNGYSEQTVNFSDEEVRMLTNQALAGEKAFRIRSGADWLWLGQYIFAAIFEEAVMTLRNARTDEDRMKAQQMFLACEKPKKQLDFLISQGDAARASLVEIQNATLANKNEEQDNA